MKKLYLEQSIINYLLENNTNWKDTQIGKTLLELQYRNKIEIWISPQNCIELAIWKDLDKRQLSATILEELTCGKRMTTSYEFIILNQILSFINKHWSESEVNYNLYDKICYENQKIYSCLLAHMSALRNYDASGADNTIIKTKLLNKLKHIEIIKNPEASLKLFIEGGEDSYIEEIEFNKKYSSLSIDDIKEIIKKSEYEIKNQKINSNIIQQFQKQRDTIIDNYCVHIAFPAYLSCFGRHIMDLMTIFDYKFIVQNWNRKLLDFENNNIISLPTNIIEKAKSNYFSLTDYKIIILFLILRYKKFLYIPRMMMEICLKEIEKGLQTKQPPTAGLILDLDHAATISVCDIFFTYDSKLSSTIKTWLKKHQLDNDKFCVSSLSELKRFVEK